MVTVCRPDSVAELYELAVTYHKQGQLEEAEHLYLTILEKDAVHAFANHNLGVISQDVGKYDDSLSYFRTALESNPNEPQLWVSYIDALIKTQPPADLDSLISVSGRLSSSKQLNSCMYISMFDAN